MKEPKKWTRPRLYWTDSEHSDDCPLIIIYPDDRRPERASVDRAGGKFMGLTPCWFRLEMEGKPELQRKAMMGYAKKNGFKRHFIGEL